MAVGVGVDGRRLLLAADVPMALVVALRPQRRLRRRARQLGQLEQHLRCARPRQQQQLDRAALAHPVAAHPLTRGTALAAGRRAPQIDVRVGGVEPQQAGRGARAVAEQEGQAAVEADGRPRVILEDVEVEEAVRLRRRTQHAAAARLAAARLHLPLRDQLERRRQRERRRALGQPERLERVGEVRVEGDARAAVRPLVGEAAPAQRTGLGATLVRRKAQQLATVELDQRRPPAVTGPRHAEAEAERLVLQRQLRGPWLAAGSHNVATSL